MGKDRAPPPARPGSPPRRRPTPSTSGFQEAVLGDLGHSSFPDSEVPTKPANFPAPMPTARPAPWRPTTPASRAPGPTARPPASRGSLPGAQVEPAVLIVGAQQSFLEALAPALARHHVYVETCDTSLVLESVVATAPDLVLLTGDAAKHASTDVLSKLAASPHSSVVPVALLGDDAALESRLQAFRHGAAAVIPRSASIDHIAARIAELAREIPDRGGAALGDVGEATLHELVEALSRELRTGILSVQTPEGSEQEAVRLVLGAGRPLSDAIDDFVERVRSQVVMAEPLRYEFDERAGGTVQWLGAEEAVRNADKEDIDGLRLLLADDDTARADAVTRELRERGMTVVVTDLEPSNIRFERLRQLDPAILLIGEEQARGAGYELMRKLRRDIRLRWAALLVVRWNEVWTEASTVPAIERIAGTLATLSEPERSARDRAKGGSAFDTRLEIVGPARLLRALASAERSVRATITNPRVMIQVDLSDGLVVGAKGETIGPSPLTLEGPTALSALLVLSSGRVHVEPVEQAATANVMATVDVALNLADAEPPPIPPSIPSPARRDGAAAPKLRAPEPSAADIPGLPKKRRRSSSAVPTWLWAVGAVGLLGSLGAVGLWAGSRLRASTPTAEASARKAPATGSATLPPAAAATTEPAASAATAATAPAAASAATAASAAAAASAPAPPASAPSAEPDAPLTEPRETAPTCKSLLGDLPPAAGVFPGAAYDQMRQARKALMRGDLDEAQRSYCRALRLDEKNPAISEELARLLLVRRDGVAAIDAAKAALRGAPDDRGALLALADGMALTGDFDAAREPLLRGLGVESTGGTTKTSVVRAQLQLAEQSGHRHDTPSEERYYRRAYVLDTTSIIAAMGLARTLLKTGRVDAAAVWARRATAIDKGSAVAHLLLGDVLAKKGDKSAAEAAWKQAQLLEPDNAEVRARLLAGR